MAVPQLRPLALRQAAPIALALYATLAHGDVRAQLRDMAHTVQPGDTLVALAGHYLGRPELWPQLQVHNRVANPRRLQPGSVLTIPMQLLPMGAAQISYVHGQASVTPPGSANTNGLQAGQPLAEGARMRVAPEAFVTVRLADGTLIRVQGDSELQLQQLRRRGRAGDAQSVLELRRGGVETSVPTGGSGARRLEIRTPQASTSVRGTRFAVTVADDQRTLATVTEGQVAVAPVDSGATTGAASRSTTLVAAGQGVAAAANGQVGAPQALLPAPDLSGLPTTVHDADFLRLTLTNVAQATAYQVQVARDADFTEVVRAGAFAGPSVRMRAVDDGDYHLAVRAVDGAGLPGLVARRTLTVKAHPVPPLQQAPAPGATVSRTRGELSCTPVLGSARYRIQVAGDASFDKPLLDETRVEHCGTQLALLAPGNYYWRTASVRELPGGGSDQGPYAPAQPFTVADNPGTLNAAALQEGGTGPGLQLRWPGEQGQSFRLQLAGTEDFAKPLVDEHLRTPDWTAAGLAPGVYFVRIQARDPSGLESEFSTPRLVHSRAAVQSGTGLPVTSSDGRPLSRP